LTSTPWPEISDMAKDLIKKLLQVDPEKRYNAKQALLHQWILRNNRRSSKLDNVVSHLGIRRSFRASQGYRFEALPKSGDSQFYSRFNSGDVRKFSGDVLEKSEEFCVPRARTQTIDATGKDLPPQRLVGEGQSNMKELSSLLDDMDLFDEASNGSSG